MCGPHTRTHKNLFENLEKSLLAQVTSFIHAKLSTLLSKQEMAFDLKFKEELLLTDWVLKCKNNLNMVSSGNKSKMLLRARLGTKCEK